RRLPMVDQTIQPELKNVPARPGTAQDIVRLSEVHFAWPGQRSFSLTIDHFSVSRGERLMLIGPSGGGKSTFLSLLSGILTPQRGTVEILGTDIARLSGAARDRFRSEHFGI